MTVDPPQGESAPPSLREDLKVAVQMDGGRKWFVLHNPSTGRYHRLSPAALALLRRLDGRTAVTAVWATKAHGPKPLDAWSTGRSRPGCSAAWRRGRRMPAC